MDGEALLHHSGLQHPRSLSCFPQVVDASQARAEQWLDVPYKLTDAARDVRDHDILEWEATGKLGGRPLPW